MALLRSPGRKTTTMRMMMKVQLDTAATSPRIEDGSLPRVMQQTLGTLNPEAAYFGPEDGVRTAFIIFDMNDPSQLPSISEPLFSQFNARVYFFPVMDQQDLQRGLSQVGQ